MPARPHRLLSTLFQSSPLRLRPFRLFYYGSVGTALGYTMQATVAAWLMTTLTPSALMVALVQTASTAPSLLFGMVAGTLADIVDRRRVLAVTQVVLLTTTALLGVATLAGWIGPWSLLTLTFLVGACFTFYMPAQQATVNDLVPRSDLPRAVALGAVAFNVSRAIGPALAGTITAWLGSGSALLAASVFFGVMFVAIRAWRSPAMGVPGIPETLLSGLRSGLRFARHSPPIRALIIRTTSFSICASAVWALMAVIARDQFAQGAGGFGVLSASFGVGAVVGALSIPRHLQRLPLNSVVTFGVWLWAAATLVIAVTSTFAVALAGAAACGVAWVSVLASLSAGTQSTAPGWVRARAVAMNLVANQASLALGGVLWGAVATRFGIRVALASSAVMAVVLLLLHRRVRVALGEEADITPGVQLPDLAISIQPMPEDGPVLIQLEYRIDPENREAFLAAIDEVGDVRRRNGATSWMVFRDLEDAGRYVERFIITSWAEYVRLRARATMADRQLVDQMQALQRPGVEIRISRLIGVARVETPARAVSRG